MKDGPGDRTEARRRQRRPRAIKAELTRSRGRSCASSGVVPGPRHRAGRRRPGLAVVRRRQAQGLRRGRHRVDPRRPAGDRDRRPRSRPSSTGSTPTRRAPATSSSCRCPGAGRERAPGLHRPGQGRRRTAPGQPRLAGARQARRRCRAPRYGIVELLRRHGVAIAGAEVVVVGRGVTVGRPLGLLLTRRSENATVTLCHTGTRDLAAHVRNADIVVAAAGVPGHHHRRHGQAGRRGPRRGRLPGRRQARRRRRRRRLGRRRLGLAQPRRRRPDDPGDAAVQHRRRWPSSRWLGRSRPRSRTSPEPDATRTRANRGAALSVDHRRRVLPAGPGRLSASASRSSRGGDWRLGIRVLAVGLLVAAACALVLPARDAGMLAVRHRPST